MEKIVSHIYAQPISFAVWHNLDTMDRIFGVDMVAMEHIIAYPLHQGPSTVLLYCDAMEQIVRCELLLETKHVSDADLLVEQISRSVKCV